MGAGFEQLKHRARRADGNFCRILSPTVREKGVSVVDVKLAHTQEEPVGTMARTQAQNQAKTFGRVQAQVQAEAPKD